MKRIAVIALALVALTTTSALAQSTGTLTILGKVNKASAIRWQSFTSLNSEVGSNTPAVANSPLSFTLDVDDIAAGNNLNSYAGGTVQMILRSNAAYDLTAEVTTNTGFGVLAAGDVVLSDVGFGVAGLANSGAGTKVFGNPAVDGTVSGTFASNPALASKDVDDEPIFANTLADVAAPTTIVSGPRISNRGGVNSPNNGLLVNTTLAFGPLFFTPVDPFSATVTFTLATP